MRSIGKPVNGIGTLLREVFGVGLIGMGLISVSLSGCGGGDTDPDLDFGPDFSNSLLQVKTTFSDTDPQLFGEIAFTWEEITGATHYRFYADVDGDSDGDGEFEFVQIGADIPTGTDPLQATIAISVHLFEWDKARFRLDWCDAMGCTEAGQQDARFLSQFFVSPLINAGTALAYAEDGATMVVGAPLTSSFECETITPVVVVDNEPTLQECEYNSDLSQEEVDALMLRETIPFAGSAGVFIYADGIWELQAILRASNIEEGDNFGTAVAISDDGNTVAVSALGEDSSAAGIDGDAANNDAPASGAVYVYKRADMGGTFEWNQVAYVKASNPDGDPDPDDDEFDGDSFGNKVALSADGTTLAVAAVGEDSNALGIDGDGSDNTASNAGALYVFKDTGGTWAQEAYIKPSNTDAGDAFGSDIALSASGDRLAVGTPMEASGAAGIDGDGFNNAATASGAAYVFERSGSAWSQQSYIKAAVPDPGDEFGFSVALNAAGDVLAISAIKEDGSVGGINVPQANNESVNTGAAYLFEDTAGVWAQTNFFKASNADAVDQLGFKVALNSTGDFLLATSVWEGGRGQGINPNAALDNFVGSGAAYLFLKDGADWNQHAYIKATGNAPNINFGLDADTALDGDRLAITDFSNSTVYIY